MIYIKSRLDSGEEISVDVCEDDFYSTCPKCGEEIHLDICHLQTIINRDDFDFSSTSFFCEKCKRKHFFKFKGDDKK